MNDAFSTALANAYNGEKTRGAFNKYSAPGARCGGTVVSRDLFQATDPKTRQKKAWDDGNPIMKAVIVVQTDLREDADDDGQRGIYVNWYGDDLKNLKAAIDAAGDTDLQIGGWFGAHFVREEQPAAPGLNGRKVYEYQYQKPAFISQGQTAAQPPQNQPQTAQQPRTAQDYAQAAANGPQAPQNAAPQFTAAPPQNTYYQQNAAPQAQPQAQPPVPAWAQNPQPPAQPQPPQGDQAVINLISQGFTDEDIAATTGAPIEQIRAYRG